MGRIAYQITANASKALAAFTKIGQKQEEVTEKIRRTTKASKETEGSAKGLLKSFAGIASGAALVGKAIAVINQGMERFNALGKKGADDFATEASIRKKFGTIAKGDQKRFDQLNALAREISLREGISFAQAGETVFSSTSSGFSPDEIRSIAKVQRISDDPKFAFETVKAFRSLFGESAGSAGEILNKVLAASADSPVSFEAFGGAAGRAAGSFRQLGGSDEELLAGVSVLAEGNPAQLEQQVTQLDALARQLAKDDQFKGLGFVGSLKKLEQLIASGGTLQKILKESNAVKGGSLALENLGEIENRLGKIEQAEAATGTAQSPISRSLRVLSNDPSAVLARQSDIAKQEEANATRLQGMRETAEQAILSKAKAEILRQLNAGEIGGIRAMGRLGDLDTLDSANLQDLSSVGGAAAVAARGVGGRSGTADEIENRLINAFGPVIDKFNAAAENLRSAAKDTKESNERRNRQNPEAHNEGI